MERYFKRTKHCRWLYDLIHHLLSAIYRIRYRCDWDISTLDGQPVILAPNHTQAIDPFIYGIAWNQLTRLERPVWFMTKVELFYN